MNKKTKVQDYILSNHVHYAAPSSELKVSAYERLLRPIDAVPIESFPLFTQTIGGFRPREFSILCGATGTGKTTLLANLSASLMKQGIPHFVASVETGATDFVTRVISVLKNEDWNTGDPIHLDAVRKFDVDHGKHLEGNYLQLSLYENRFSVQTLMSDIARQVLENQVRIAFVDNMNFFMEVTRAADQVVEMDRVIHDLIIFCKTVDVHVVMVMHPRKTENGRIDSEFDIKGSSTAVQEAHNVFLFNRPGDDLISKGICTKFDREMRIAKMRRKGRAVGARVVFKCTNGVSYIEEGQTSA